ncbi:hypothetical protein CALVIDRAFT_597685 [Calocera viscosa TUFC12733]|uniref:Uncharacterized protein n=1 Tax=Calocera viscosa (strain TUFC12733) TaxID=1330018 RepID=A0A167N688_CALVF|nr:hypothetical protein CALVIDRAFT_597685 [Calocera viscosa TUFC12733]
MAHLFGKGPCSRGDGTIPSAFPQTVFSNPTDADGMIEENTAQIDDGLELDIGESAREGVAEEDAVLDVLMGDDDDGNTDPNSDGDGALGTAQFLLSLGAQPLSALIPKTPTPPPPDSDDDALPDMSDEAKGSNIDIGHLYQICNRLYGSHKLLKWDYGPDGGAGNKDKKATLTIELPNGNVRTFKSRGHWTKKSQAKASSALVAIESGAIDFLETGTDKRVREQVAVAEDSSVEKKPVQGEVDETQILDQCKMWRQNKVQPVFTYTVDSKQGTGFGCVLSIYLSKEIQRSWSVRIAYGTKQEAKWAACADAIRLGILDFIAHGDGLTEPWDDEAAAKHPKKIKELMFIGATKENPNHITQQGYYDALPKPLTHNVGFGEGQPNPVSYLYQLFGKAQHCGVKEQFTAISEPHIHQGHGCLLRVEHRDESFSYLVPSAFAKRAEAKAAVCLLALSQGIADILEDIRRKSPRGISSGRGNGSAQNIKTEHSPFKATLSSSDKDLGEVCLNAICRELDAFKPGAYPRFDGHQNPDGSYTTRLEVFLDRMNRRVYTSPGEYKTMHNAKLAVSILAVERGILEFVRFRGGPVPHGYLRPPVGGVDIPYVPQSEHDPGAADLRSRIGDDAPGPRAGSQSSHSRRSPPAVYPSYGGRLSGGYSYPEYPPREYREDWYPPPPESHPLAYARPDERTYYDYPEHRVHHPASQDPRGRYPPSYYPSPSSSGSAAYPPDFDPNRPSLPPAGGGYDRYGYGRHAEDTRYYEYQRNLDAYGRYPEEPPPSPPHRSPSAYPQEQGYYPHYPDANPRLYDRNYPPRAEDRRPYYERPHEYPPPREDVGPYYSGEPPYSATRAEYPDKEVFPQTSPASDYHTADPSVAARYTPYEGQQREVSLQDFLKFRESSQKHEAGPSPSISLETYGRPDSDNSRFEYTPIGDSSFRHPPQPEPPAVGPAASNTEHLTSEPSAIGLSSAALFALLGGNPLQDSVSASSKPPLSVAIPPPDATRSTPASSKSVTFALSAGGISPVSTKDPRKRPHLQSTDTKTPVSPIKTKSFVNDLLELCKARDLAEPDFRSETVTTEAGVKYRVWLMLGRQKMELKTTFNSVAQGYERLSKVVKERLEGESEYPQAKRRKIGEDAGDGAPAV